jgi:hypothetical protein
LDRFASITADALAALPAGAGIRLLGPPPERLTFTAEERELLDRLTRDTPDVVPSSVARRVEAAPQPKPRQ